MHATSWDGRVLAGAVYSARPHPRHSASEVAKPEDLGSTDADLPDPGRALGLLAPPTSLTPSCKPAASRRGRVTRRGPGEKTAGAYPAPRRGPRCDPPAAATAHSKPAAASPAAPAASGRRSPRPAETGGRWRGSGAARARFGLPRPSGGSRGGRSAACGPGRPPAGALPAAPRSG